MKISPQTTDFSDKRVIGLDLVRSFSIILVLLAHGGGFLLRSYHELLVPIVFSGILGVEIFFILSGYLIGTIIVKNFEDNYSNKKALNFLTRRWFRTIPNYVLFFIINLIFFYDYSGRAITHMGLTYLSFTQNFLSYNNQEFFPESWSLAIEEWFYLLIILSIAIFNSVLKSAPKNSIYISCAMLLIFPPLLRFYYIQEFNSNWFEVTRTTVLHLDSIIWGLGLAVLTFINPEKVENYRKKLALIGIIGLLICTIIFCYYFSVKQLDNSVGLRLFLPNSFSICITCLLPYFNSLEIRSQKFKHVIISTSLWSYSLYLSNLPIFHLVDGISTTANPFFQLFLFLILCFLVSSILFNYFEQPITKLREKFSEKT